MALNKYHTIRCGMLVLAILLLVVVLFQKCERSHYKIGPSGEFGEITIMKDYVIFGHYSSLLAPRSNYIRIPIEYDSHVLTMEVTADSIICIEGYPNIISYELSCFNGMIDTKSLLFDSQKLREHEVVMRCNIFTYGYGLYPTFYYSLSDSTIVCQQYQQRFPWESPKNWCHFDTIR